MGGSQTVRRPGTVPLSRKLDRTLVTMLGVKFLMQDGDVEVPCRADRELLRSCFQSVDRESDSAAFDEHRSVIERAASDKYDAGSIEPFTDAKVVVGRADLVSPLGQKMGAGL